MGALYQLFLEPELFPQIIKESAADFPALEEMGKIADKNM